MMPGSVNGYRFAEFPACGRQAQFEMWKMTLSYYRTYTKLPALQEE